MIRTEKYTSNELTGATNPEERARRREFNGRFDRALEKSRLERPHFERQSQDSFKVTGEGDDYFVRFYTSDGREYVHCTCDAGTYNQPCYHVLAVIPAHVPVKDVPKQTFGFAPQGVTFLLNAGDSLPAFASAVRVTVEPVN